MATDADDPRSPANELGVANTAVGSDAGTAEGSQTLRRGTDLGRYIILDRLGGGGMGVVYTAYDPELDRKIAVKLLRPGADSSAATTEGRARLLREAQAMARLQHPNVIAVYDVGTFQDQVFVAMELVDGVTLRQWMKERQRSWREVLEVFVPAGRALAAAHAAGIVHRDFKPDNVMVGEDGRVRVLDFGLARAAQGEAQKPSLSEAGPADAKAVVSTGKGMLATPLTRTGSLIGTPVYMSPEQWLDQPADARSDQYSFCVALFEALFGVWPFDGQTIALLRVAVLQGEVRAAPSDSRVPKRLRQIVLRGLAVQPTARHASMDALLAELAHDPSVTRRRWLVAAGALALAGALGLGYRTVRRQQSVVCQGVERKLAGVWDDARKHTVHAAFAATKLPFAEDAWRGVERSLDGYLRDWAKMHTDACEATRLRGEQSEELLDLRMECLGERLQEVQAQVEVFATADAKVVEKAVQAADSMPSTRQCADAAALRMPVRPPPDPTTRARVEEIRKKIAQARALEKAGKYPAALAIAAPAVDEAKSLHYRPVEAEALLQLGRLQDNSGDSKAAENTLEEAALAAEASRSARVAASAWGRLVYVGDHLARFDQAQAWGRLASAKLDAVGGDDEIFAVLLNGLGNIFAEQGKYDQALTHFRRALAIREAAR